MKTLVTALSVFALFACQEKKSAPASSSPAAPSKEAERKSGKAEVEFFGRWAPGEVKAAKVVFVAQAEPCVPVPEKPTRFGEATMDQPGALFAEFFIPQGTQGHACVYGLDAAGKVVGAASSTQNPMTFQGEGEVIFGKLDYVLTAP